MRSRLLALVALTAAFVIGCPAVFPEVGTRLKVPPKDAVLEPPPTCAITVFVADVVPASRSTAVGSATGVVLSSGATTTSPSNEARSASSSSGR